MLTFIIKLTLLLIGLYLLEDFGVATLVALLLAVTATSLNQYLNRKAFTMALCGLYGTIAVFVPVFSVFLPLLAFDLARYGKVFTVLLAIPVILFNPWFIPALAAAVLLEHIQAELEDISLRYRQLMDLHTEQKRVLVQKTKELTENQDKAAHLAKLSERNRIARDIHDNIGHILSRAILQTGAMRSINNDEGLKEPLKSLQDTLIGSMECIRGSIHDLKNDSIDLFQEIREVFEGADYDVGLHYDMGENVPNYVKYCFLTAAKEALTNTMRHSDATEIKVTVQEHPALYQLRIQDNGTKPPRMAEAYEGMGLQNIASRVKNAGGYFTFGYEDGFKIFITLPIGGAGQ